jgi:predicted anti-sigma-YlaC factor YlaD
MLSAVPPNDCLRARESISARLDDELSELGTARLAAHLRTCAECSAYASGLGTIAGLLRNAPLELPEVEIALPRRRRVPGLQVAAAAAAAVAVAAGSSFALGRALGTNGASTSTGAAFTGADLLSLRADSTQQHMLAMLRHLEPHGSLRIGTTLIAL